MARHHKSKRQSRLSRFHEHSGAERAAHGYYLSPEARREELAITRNKYDTLQHERNMFNDSDRNDKRPEKSGPVPRDRDGSYLSHGAVRRNDELRAAGMIHEDRNEIANLPQSVMIKPYPRTGPYLPEDLDDTIYGVDRQMNYDNSQKMAHFFPKKV